MTDPVYLPTVEQAFAEAWGPMQHAWSSPAVYLARKQCGGGRFPGLAHDAALAKFEPVYLALCVRLIKGQRLPDECFVRTPPPRRCGAPVDGGAVLKSLSEQLRGDT